MNFCRVKKTNYVGTYDNKQNNMFCKRGDMFFAEIGKTKQGSEQTGTRPVLVLQNNTGNKHSPTVIVALATSQLNKANLPTHVKIYKRNYEALKRDSLIMLEQIQTIDKTRLLNKIAHLNEQDLNDVNMAIKVSLSV